MKVFEVYPLAKPPEGNFEHYASLLMQEKDRRYIRVGDFDGQPYSRRWQPIELYIDKPKQPRPDFYHFGLSAFVCNERALEHVQGCLEEAGELLPVSIEREPGEFFIFNVTNCINVLDHEKSSWRGYGPNNMFKRLTTPVFIPERFGDESIFKFPEACATTYCLERSGEYREGEFKALVEHHGLTGIEFRLVWSDETPVG